ncbi:MAG: hypothetical protein ABI693_02310 [Bryobacteraceae bacterium]
MRTTVQLAANRVNAGQSTGPRTDEGKAIVVLNGEDRDEYEALLARYKEEQMPGCAIERSIIALLAECAWRNQHCNRIQYQMIEESGLTIETYLRTKRSQTAALRTLRRPAPPRLLPQRRQRRPLHRPRFP